MKKIKLTSGKTTIVDDEDYKKYSKYNWWENCNGYAWRQVQKNNKNTRKRQSIFLHRQINNTPYKMDTDHINRDKLDNRKVNLRSVSRSQNMLNLSPTKANRSGAVGVCKHKKSGKWRSYITINNKQKSLGYFELLDDAIKARKEYKVCV
jgi:hypothetical protein